MIVPEWIWMGDGNRHPVGGLFLEFPPRVATDVLRESFGYEVVRTPADSLQKSKDLEKRQNSPLSPLREA